MGGARGTVYVEVRQSVWETGVPGDLEAWLLGSVRPTRIDLAVDGYGSDRPGPAALFRRLPAAETRTHRRSWVLTVDGDGGEKLTVGARSSDRYLRVYVKGAGRVRHELELKGAIARGAAEALVAGGDRASLFSAEYGRIVRWH
jgi:DNA relaxase NicK